MEGVGPIGDAGGYGAAPLPNMTGLAGGNSGAQLPSAVQPGEKNSLVGATADATSLAASSTQVGMRTESYFETYGASANQDIVNLLMLLAALKFLTSDDEEEQDKALAMMMMLGAMASQQSQSGMVMYQSSELWMSQDTLAMSSASATASQTSAGQMAYGQTVSPSPQAGAAGLDVSG